MAQQTSNLARLMVVIDMELGFIPDFARRLKTTRTDAILQLQKGAPLNNINPVGSPKVAVKEYVRPLQPVGGDHF